MTTMRSDLRRSAPPVVRPLSLEQLPPETLQHIISHVDNNDLLIVQTLSKQFHFLASGELYRNLDFSLTCIETEDRGDASTRVSDALQTINTSDHDYAQHIKTFHLGHASERGGYWASPGGYGEVLARFRIVFDSKTDASKLLNTGVFQMLRKASMLEEFAWNVPIELSGRVYAALHKILSIRKLHVRMDINMVLTNISRSREPLIVVPDPPYPLPHSSNSLPMSLAHKRKKTSGSSFWGNQRAFSGFRTLNALNIMSLSSLDCIPELRQCIKACAASLKNLTLTLDPQYTARIQRSSASPHANEPDDLSDSELTEDELTYSPTTSVLPGQQQVSETDRRNQKVALESLLANLFDLQTSATKGSKLEQKIGLSGGKCLLEEEKSATIKKMETVMRSLREDDATEEKLGLSESGRLEKYKMMKELAELYISKHGPHSTRSLRAEGKKVIPPSKSYKPPKPKAPKYAPPIPDSSELLDNFDFEEFLDDVGATMSSPMSIDSAKGGLGNKPWPSNHNQYSPYGNYLPDTLPPLPVPGSTNPSKDPLDLTSSSKSSKWGKLVDQAASSNKYLPYTDSDLQNSSASFAPAAYNAYSTNSHKAYTKHMAQKNKSNSKSNGLLPPYSNPYPNGTMNKVGTYSSLPPKKVSTHKNKPKGSSWKAKEVISYSHTSSDSDEDSGSSHDSDLAAKGPFFAADTGKQSEDELNVDMEHPDEDYLENAENQESASDADSPAMLTPRKRFKALQKGPSTLAEASSPINGTHVPCNEEANGSTDLDKMHEYIRASHGIQLEVLRLQNIPLKASIVGRALDLRKLQRITLLDVGPQDAFWTLLVKLTNVDSPIAFKVIHTDHVSFSFLKYLATYSSLESLYVHERRTKANESETTNNVILDDIRRQALRPHVQSLKRIMIRNERNDAWDFDLKTLHMLAMQARKLEELAINVRNSVYHSLLQILPAFHSLRVLQLILLRGGADRGGAAAALENLSYSVDALAQCPDIKLRYVAIGERVTDLAGHEQFRLQLKKMMDSGQGDDHGSQSSGKGKGKAKDSSPGEIDELSDNEMAEKFHKVQQAQRRLRVTRRCDEVEGVRIFEAELRRGRL